MNLLEFTALVWIASAAAGFLGALTGLGGGVVIVPLLVLAFHVDIHYAIGASLISVIATSSGAAAAYLREGYTNTRAAMVLEIASTAGAVMGAAIAAHVPPAGLAVAFGIVLLYSASQAEYTDPEFAPGEAADRWATVLRLDGSYPTPEGPAAYRVRGVPAGFGLMCGAGVLSGLLGIGSGAVKVLALDRAMRMPFKVSTTTSNFMIGVTAAASAGIYLRRGYLDPGLAMPVVLGVLVGSLAGARMLAKAPIRRLRIVFTAVIVLLAFEMLFNGVTGRLR